MCIYQYHHNDYHHLARFADCATYYGLIMTSTSLVDDLYLGYTVNILVELPAAVTYVLLINR